MAVALAAPLNVTTAPFPPVVGLTEPEMPKVWAAGVWGTVLLVEGAVLPAQPHVKPASTHAVIHNAARCRKGDKRPKFSARCICLPSKWRRSFKEATTPV